jgi:ADP-ribosylglycohydrolase
MLGAIAGDIIGSPYEGMMGNIRTTEFPLFRDKSHFTDDTVLTVAVADAILHGGGYVEKFKEYYALYPHAGYGGAFRHWARSDESTPYGSWGNGSAMRVGPVGFALDSIQEVLDEAKRSAEVTHDHPEGIKGAQATAAAIFLSRAGASKSDIREYVEGAFGYDLSEPLESLRTWYAREYDPMYISCQLSVPAAMITFLDSSDFEDSIRKTVSIGGDSDTLACINGGIAHAFYKEVPAPIENEVLARLDERLSMVVIEFMERFCGNGAR